MKPKRVSRIEREDEESVKILKHSKESKQDGRIDYLLLFTTFILLGIGLTALFSASAAFAYVNRGDLYFYLKRQLIWLAIGIISLWVSAKFNYRKYRVLYRPFLFLTLLFLCLVFVPGIGRELRGVYRSIGAGFISFTPSEIAKLGVVIYLSFSLVKKKDKMKSYVSGSLPYFIILGVMSILVVMEPDLGSALIIAVIAFILLYAGGARISHLLYTIFLASVPLYFSIFEVGYRENRIMGFLNPEQDPLGMGFHPIHLKSSLGSGGLWGLGLGQGKEKLFYLPTPHTDSIFAVIGEEMGLVIAIAVVIGLLFFFLRGVKIAEHAPDPFAKYFVIGVISWLLVQAFVNIGSMVGIMPMTGITLPFISYGGTSLAISLAGIGVILNISRYCKL